MLALSIGAVLAVEADPSAEEVSKNIFADMDFMDPDASIFEMRKKLVSVMPIPEYVMNDKVRSYIPNETDKFLTLKDGRFEQEILGVAVPMREFTVQKLKEFHEWLTEKNEKIPKSFFEATQDLRVL